MPRRRVYRLQGLEEERSFGFKGRSGYVLKPSKANPRVRRWTKERQSARTTNEGTTTWMANGFAALALPGIERRLPERFSLQQFGPLQEGRMGRDGPVWVGQLPNGESWVLKKSIEHAIANEILASVVGRSLGLKVPPAAVVEGGREPLAASLYVPELRHAAPFNSRNPFHFGPDGPADIPNYWQQVALGKLFGDIDRKGGNWGVTPDGQRWDFDFSLSEAATQFIAPDAPDWNRHREQNFREVIETMRQRISPSAMKRFLEPYHALAESDPEKLYGWVTGVGDLGVFNLRGLSLKDALIEAGHANRRAAQAALSEVGR